MPRSMLPTLCAILLTVVPALRSTAETSDTLAFVGGRHTTFDDAYQYSTLDREFAVSNRTDTPITIIDGIAVSGTGHVAYDPEPIAPGATAKVHVTQPIGDTLGTTSFRFAVITDEPGRPKHRFSLSGFVQSAYDPEAAAVNFGFIDGRTGASAELELHSREVEALRLASATTEHPSVTIDTSPTGLASEGLLVRVSAPPGLPRGLFHGMATIETNVPSQPRFDFSYTANVYDDVVPSENPVPFGLIRSGQEAIKSILVTSRSNTPFEIDRATNTIGEILGVSWKPCDDHPQGPSPCHLVQLSLSPEKQEITDGTVFLHVSGDPEPVPIRVTSWVVSPDTVVKQIAPGAPQ